MDKVEEEISELLEAIQMNDAAAIHHEYGDLLLSIASLGRHLNVVPEDSLREANNRFALRFRHMEEQAKIQKMDLSKASDAQLDRLWEQAKKTTAS